MTLQELEQRLTDVCLAQLEDHDLYTQGYLAGRKAELEAAIDARQAQCGQGLELGGKW